MEHIDISIKKNCFLKKLHRRTKSNYDNRIENNLSKTDKIDKEFQTFPHQKTLQKNASSTFEFQNKEISPDTDQKIKKLIESKHNESNKKEIFIEKLDLTAEEMIINQKKSDLLTNNSAIFEFGKKKQIDLFYAKGLETSKSSNFEEKISEIKQKYKITDDENNNFFVITEQNNEIEDVIRRDSFKNKLPNNFFPNKVKSFLEKDVQREKNEFITNENQKISHQKTISLVLTRQNLNKLNNNFIPNFYNNNSSSPEQANVMKLMQNLEKRVLFLENQVISLKNENLKLLKTSQMFEKTLEQFTQENNSKITVIFYTI